VIPTESGRRSAGLPTTALLVGLVSGACALCYESLWLRWLALLFGNTVAAAAAVVAAFMGGLALGAFSARRLVRSSLAPLRLYALLELGVAGWALCLPALLHVLEPACRWLYTSTDGQGSSLTIGRLLLSGAVLLVPTTCMGASFPVLGRVLESVPALAVRRIGLLYAVNTAGGTLGLIASGFWLIPRLGVDGSNAATALVSALVAATAWALGSLAPAGAAAEGKVSPAAVGGEARAATLALVIAAVVGFVGLAFEVLGFRLLLLVFGSTTYAFTIMLSLYLAGIAAGSGLGRVLLSRGRASLFVVLLLGALSIGGMVASVDHLPQLYLLALKHVGFTWAGDVGARAGIAGLVLFPATFCFGAAFPLVLQSRVRGVAAAQEAGSVYVANTLGAIGGSLSGAFVLLPLLGIQRGLLTLVGILLAIACVSAPWSTRRSAAASACLLLSVIAVGIVATRPWDRKLLAEGVYMSPWGFFDSQGNLTLEKVVTEHQLIYSREGAVSTVAIVSGQGMVSSFRIDGKVEISDLPADRRLGRLMGHLPMLLHPAPERALNIGLGAGLTVGSLAAYPAVRIDVVELEPRVVEAARLWSSLNHGVVDDPRLRLLFGDGRNHLGFSSESYDVITSDPFEPTVAGAASLFTREAFVAARARLRTGGLVCQYLPLYELGPAEFDSVLGAFAITFRHVSVWFTGRDAILVGSDHEPVVQWERLCARLRDPPVHRDLEDCGLSAPARLLALRIAEFEGGPPSELQAPVNSDAFPYLEFAAPRRRWQTTLRANLLRLLRLRSPEPPKVLPVDHEVERTVLQSYRAGTAMLRALVDFEAGAFEAAAASSRQALALDPGQPLASRLLAELEIQASLRSGDLDRALKALPLDPEALLPRLGLVEALLDRDRLSEAEALVAQVLEKRPRSLEARLHRAELLRRRGDRLASERCLREVLEDFPESSRVQRALARLRATP
jgi:spermidine synthase